MVANVMPILRPFCILAFILIIAYKYAPMQGVELRKFEWSG